MEFDFWLAQFRSVGKQNDLGVVEVHIDRTSTEPLTSIRWRGENGWKRGELSVVIIEREGDSHINHHAERGREAIIGEYSHIGKDSLTASI